MYHQHIKLGDIINPITIKVNTNSPIIPQLRANSKLFYRIKEYKWLTFLANFTMALSPSIRSLSTKWKTKEIAFTAALQSYFAKAQRAVSFLETHKYKGWATLSTNSSYPCTAFLPHQRTGLRILSMICTLINLPVTIAFLPHQRIPLRILSIICTFINLPVAVALLEIHLLAFLKNSIASSVRSKGFKVTQTLD